VRVAQRAGVPRVGHGFLLAARQETSYVGGWEPELGEEKVYLDGRRLQLLDLFQLFERDVQGGFLCLCSALFDLR
jgi:hypothetical protein